MTDEITVQIWEGRYDEYPDEPDGEIELKPETTHLFEDNPRHHSPYGLSIDEEDLEGYDTVTFNVYTSDSVRSPPGYDSHVETSYWDGPMERGLTFDSENDYPPFGCEIWGRVLFFIEVSK